MNYFYDLPDDLQNKILERKQKLERIDELKNIIDTFDVEEWWDEAFVISNITYDKLKYKLLEKEYDELHELQYELWEEDISGFSYNPKFKRKDNPNVITIYNTSSEEEDEEINDYDFVSLYPSITSYIHSISLYPPS